MDFNVNTSTSSPSVHPTQQHQLTPSTPTAVILARNIQKFFQAKSDLLAGTRSPSNNTKKSSNSDLDVPTVLKDIDEILDSRTIEDGRMLLRGMVADLLKEVDLLRFKGDSAATQLATVKEERDVVNNDYRDRLVALLRALQHHTDDKVHDQQRQHPSSSSSSSISASLIQQRLALQKLDCNTNANNTNSSKLLTADEATMLTIQALTRKIEALNIENTDQKDQIAVARERNEDLESINAAQQFKIAALEKQFCSINQKRHKVVTQRQAVATGVESSVHPHKLNDNNHGSSTSGSTRKEYKVFIPPKLLASKENLSPHANEPYEKDATSAALALIKTPLQSTDNKKVVVVSPTDVLDHRPTSSQGSLKERAVYAAKRPKSRPLSSSTRLVKLVDPMSSSN